MILENYGPNEGTFYFYKATDHTPRFMAVSLHKETLASGASATYDPTPYDPLTVGWNDDNYFQVSNSQHIVVNKTGKVVLLDEWSEKLYSLGSQSGWQPSRVPAGDESLVADAVTFVLDVTGALAHAFGAPGKIIGGVADLLSGVGTEAPPAPHKTISILDLEDEREAAALSDNIIHNQTQISRNLIKLSQRAGPINKAVLQIEFDAEVDLLKADVFHLGNQPNLSIFGLPALVIGAGILMQISALNLAAEHEANTLDPNDLKNAQADARQNAKFLLDGKAGVERKGLEISQTSPVLGTPAGNYIQKGFVEKFYGGNPTAATIMAGQLNKFAETIQNPA
jgi:hypothetical protein